MVPAHDLAETQFGAEGVAVRAEAGRERAVADGRNDPAIPDILAGDEIACGHRSGWGTCSACGSCIERAFESVPVTVPKPTMFDWPDMM